jgi:hypothetical protein
MRFLTQIALLLALLPIPLLAQTRPAPADTTRTEPDQELDHFSGRFRGLHRITARLRGVRAAANTVYWVGADGRHLSAFQAGKLQWATDVVAPFRAEIPAARIASMALASNIIFVNLGKRGMAEIDRKTGQIVGKYFDRDPNNLVAEPN